MLRREDSFDDLVYNKKEVLLGEKKMNHKPVVVGIGELLWDMLPSGKRAGGAPINFVYHATQLGAEGYAISAVGKDDLGAEILQELAKAGIEHQTAEVPYPTGKVLVSLKDGIPDYTIVENVAWDHIPLTQQSCDLVKRADCVCFGSLALRHADSRQTAERLLELAPREALRFFDINLRQQYYSKELIEKLLRYANAFKLNDEEILVLRKMFALHGTDDEVCRTLLDRFDLRYVVFTAGDKFSAIYCPTEKSFFPTPKVEVVDTVGAGDSFSGAFVYNILTGKSLKEAHGAAVKVAAFVCTQSGAWPAYDK